MAVRPRPPWRRRSGRGLCPTRMLARGRRSAAGRGRTIRGPEGRSTSPGSVRDADRRGLHEQSPDPYEPAPPGSGFGAGEGAVLGHGRRTSPVSWSGRHVGRRSMRGAAPGLVPDGWPAAALDAAGGGGSCSGRTARLRGRAGRTRLPTRRSARGPARSGCSVSGPGGPRQRGRLGRADFVRSCSTRDAQAHSGDGGPVVGRRPVVGPAHAPESGRAGSRTRLVPGRSTTGAGVWPVSGRRVVPGVAGSGRARPAAARPCRQATGVGWPTTMRVTPSQRAGSVALRPSTSTRAPGTSAVPQVR